MTELWTIRDIGAFGKWAPTYVAQSIVTLPGFPLPIRITGPDAKPRWIADDVKAFIATRVSAPCPQRSERSKLTGT